MAIQCIFANVHVRFQNFFSGDSILRTGGGSVPIWIILFGGKGVSRPNVMFGNCNCEFDKAESSR